MQLPPPIKRKLPDFIRPEAKAAKKRVSFERVSFEKEIVTVDDEASEAFEAIPWVEPFVGPSQGESDVLEQMYLVFSNLSSECEDRTVEARLKKEVSGPTPPSSQGSDDSMRSDASWEFELAYSTATDFVESSDIFDFIFKYVTDHQTDIYGRVGTGLITRAMAERFLRNAPRDLLHILDLALAEAELKLVSV